MPINFVGAVPRLLNVKNQKFYFFYVFKLPPHPKTLEKSFPVPNGTIPIGHCSTSTLFLIISSTTHITVPSPPPTITLIIDLPFKFMNFYVEFE